MCPTSLAHRALLTTQSMGTTCNQSIQLKLSSSMLPLLYRVDQSTLTSVRALDGRATTLDVRKSLTRIDVATLSM